MGVLSPVLPHAGQIALDIARVRAPVLKGRIEQLHYPGLGQIEPLQRGRHCLAGPLPVRVLHQRGEGLGNGVDLALRIAATAKGLAVIIIAPQIPRAIPGAVRLLGKVP